jgi:hypothetical protein
MLSTHDIATTVKHCVRRKSVCVIMCWSVSYCKDLILDTARDKIPFIGVSDERLHVTDALVSTSDVLLCAFITWREPVVCCMFQRGIYIPVTKKYRCVKFYT